MQRIATIFGPALRLAGIVAVPLWFTACSNSTSANFVPNAPSPGQTWLFVSDVHFTPFDDPALVTQLIRSPMGRWHAILASSPRPPSPYFNDTNFALFESALSAMRQTLPNPPVVIIAGDFMAHKFPDQFANFDPGAPASVYQSFVDKTIAFLAAEFNSAYPSAQFLVAIGNNDGYCGNYMSTPKSPFLAHMAQAWNPLVNRNGRAPGFVPQFSKGGYYTANLPLQQPLPAIVLNSVFWSSLYLNGCGSPGSDPGSEELTWLSRTLNTTGQPPLLLTHIPPGIDEYASLNANAATPLYKETYTDRLLTILHGAAVGPRAFILGHIHHATFEIAPSLGGPIGTLGVPSISPNQGNNPAFVVGFIGSGATTILDTTTYVLPLATLAPWAKLYSFTNAYGLQAYNVQSLLKLQDQIAADPSVRSQFFVNYNSASATATPQPSKWPWYWCGHTNLTTRLYADCIKRTPPS